MKDTQNFTAQRLPNGVTEITDLSGVHCFLVEGRDKALLIDTMTGLRGLPAFVATLTDLPVEVALTHGHMDHAGGVFEFGRCYIHPADIPMLDGRTLPARVGYVRGQLPPGEAPEASAFVPDGPVEFVPLKAGDKLDLGGRVLEVLHVPGHTRGSLCYLDTASGDFFAGDACNNNTLLMMDVSATIEEWLMSAEYILAEGNPNVILCERGIRTFETYTRNTLDLSAVLAAKQLSHLPVVVDPSHACGRAWMVEGMAVAAVAAGADGLLIEVHNDPPNALCDGAQSLTPEQFAALMDKVRAVAACVGREV